MECGETDQFLFGIMDRLYSYCGQQLFVRGKVETAVVVLDFKNLSYSQYG